MSIRTVDTIDTVGSIDSVDSIDTVDTVGAIHHMCPIHIVFRHLVVGMVNFWGNHEMALGMAMKCIFCLDESTPDINGQGKLC